MSARSGVHTNGIESNAGCDGLALRALLQRRFKGALFFGGHSQFLGNWSLFLSLGPSRTPRPNKLCPSSPRPPPMLLTLSGPFCATPFLTGVSIKPTASNALGIYTTLAIEPAPKVFSIRKHNHRDKAYYWQAMLSGTLVSL